MSTKNSKGAKAKSHRADALVAGAQVLLGVRETGRGEVVDDAADGWLGGVAAVRGR